MLYYSCYLMNEPWQFFVLLSHHQQMLNIFCVAHKKIGLPNIPCLHLIQVGNQEESFAKFRDNDNDNIATKNSSYSELTAFYYVWKNIPSPLVGFCHYRRYLLPPSLNEWIRTSAIKSYGSGYLIPEQQLFDKFSEFKNVYQQAFIKSLEDWDMILPHPNPLPVGGFIEQYKLYHPIYPFFRMLSLLAELDNKMGLLAYEFFLQSRYAYWNNLFVTKWEIFEEYCQFLFNLLSLLEKEINLPNSTYQKRVFAFLSERLFNFWIWFKGLKISTVDWCILDSLTHQQEPHQWNGKNQVQYQKTVG